MVLQLLEVLEALAEQVVLFKQGDQETLLVQHQVKEMMEEMVLVV